MALRSHLVPSTVREFQRRESCFSWRRSGGLAGFSVEFPPEQEEEVKHVSRISGVCWRQHGKTTLWHINPWCLCAVWTNLTQPNGLWVERGSGNFSGVQTANKCATGGRRLQHTQLSTWLAKKKKALTLFQCPEDVQRTESSPINAPPPPPPSPPTGPSTSSITPLLSLPSLSRRDLIWLYYSDHLGDCAINQIEDGRCGQLPVNQPRGHWSFDGDRER